MQIKIHNLKNLTPAQQDKIRAALLKGEAVLDSNLWENKILTAHFTEARGITNRQIVDLIRSGSENGGASDNVIDVNIEGFYKRSSVIGYTYLGATWQWINRRFLDRYSGASIFAHVMHETMHRCFRFTHNSSWDTSVPYMIGNISERAYIEFHPEIEPQAFQAYHTKIITFVS